MDFKKLLEHYNYNLPKELIAQKPASLRDSARLLVYSRNSKKISYDVFANIGKYLPKNSVLVFNQTKVLPARLMVKKPTGGKCEIFYLSQEGKYIKVIADRKLLAGSKLTLGSSIYFEVIKQLNNFYFLRPSFPLSQITAVLQKYGQTPLPPYLKNSPLSEKQRREQYQTVFAKAGLSVAAPTASLHFTKKLINQLKKQGIEVKFLTLNVNLGTFAPLKDENIKTGKLHLETYEIDKKTAAYLTLAKKQGKNIIAVGTTVVRTLESAVKNSKLSKLTGATDLFIHPPYKFKFIDSLITNFHVPKSSLLMLVSSLTGRKELSGLYQKAIKKHFRFFSFGDGMLIIP
jgi:S-adenosylmethionine:tRNA ribosyltransferase-isomerase